MVDGATVVVTVALVEEAVVTVGVLGGGSLPLHPETRQHKPTTAAAPARPNMNRP